MGNLTFLSARKFAVLSGLVDGVKIVLINEDFSRWFGAYSESTEMSVPVLSHDLTEVTEEEKVLGFLKINAEKLDCKLSGIWHLLTLQGLGKPGGKLITNGDPNIFFVKDIFDMMRSIHVYWDSRKRGWCVLAYETGVSSPDWNDDLLSGSRIFKGR